MDDQRRMYKWFVLLLMSITLFISAIAGMVISPLFQEITLEIPLTKTEMGMIMGSLMLASFFFSPLAGAVADKIGCRWVFGTASFITGIAGGLRYFVQSPTALLLCMFGIGIGVAISITLGPKILISWFPKDKLATANGISSAFFSVGGAVAMGTAVGFLSPACNGWRGISLAFSVLSFFMGLLWLVLYRDQKQKLEEQEQHESIRKNFKKLLAIKDFWFLIIAYPFVLSSPMALSALLPVIFQEKGIAHAGELVSVFMIVSTVCLILGGIVSDQFGRRKNIVILLLIVFALAIPGFLLFTGVPLVLALVAAGLAAGPTASILMTATVEMEQIGPALAGSAIGLLMMIGTLGASFSPAIVGKLIDLTGSPWLGFLFLTFCSLFAALVIFPSKIR